MRLRAEQLELRSGDPRLTDAIEHARTAIDAADAGRLGAAAAYHTAAGALALGHVAAATALLRPLSASHPGPAILLAGRHLAVSGQLGVAAAVLEDTRRAAGEGRLDAEALACAAAIAADIGEAPPVGAPDGRPARPEPSAAVAAVAELTAADCFDEAAERWLAAAASAIERRAAPGDWGALVAFLTHEILGARADAPRHRLVLRPRLASSWGSFEALRIRVGDAAVDLGYERVGDVHRFRVGQERGAVPVQLVLEPGVVLTGEAATSVDGTPAELDSGRSGGRLIPRVQLVLDRERTLEIRPA